MELVFCRGGSDRDPGGINRLGIVVVFDWSWVLAAIFWFEKLRRASDLRGQERGVQGRGRF